MKLKNPIPMEKLEEKLRNAYEEGKVDFLVTNQEGIKLWNDGNLYWYMALDYMVIDVGVKPYGKPWIL